MVKVELFLLFYFRSFKYVLALLNNSSLSSRKLLLFAFVGEPSSWVQGHFGKGHAKPCRQRVRGVTSHFAPTSTGPTNSPQVGRRPISLQTLPYRNFCSGQWPVILNVESTEASESAPVQTQSRPKCLAISSLSINIM